MPIDFSDSNEFIEIPNDCCFDLNASFTSSVKWFKGEVSEVESFPYALTESQVLDKYKKKKKKK